MTGGGIGYQGDRVEGEESGGIERASEALRWGLLFGVVGALALAVYVVLIAVLLNALLGFTFEVLSRDGGSLDYAALGRRAAVGPVVCVAASGGLAWLVGRSPGTTIRPWAVGLFAGVVGLFAGYGALRLAGF